MASPNFLNTMISHMPKKIFLKFELLEYNEDTDDFEVIDDNIVEDRHLPNGVATISGGIDVNVEQDIQRTLDISIVNHEGINNWGSDFDPEDNTTFKWWLDKRLNIYMGLKIDSEDEIEFVQMGHFVITHFKTNHNLEDYPVTEIQGSSKEVLYASRRGKFLTPTTIRNNTVMTDTIETILINGGEKKDKIRIDPQINKTSLKIDYGEDLYGWSSGSNSIGVTLDTKHKAHGDSSLRIDVMDNVKYGDILAEKVFDFPFDLTEVNSMALWTRCSKNVPEGALSVILVNEDGYKVNLPTKELIGHVIEDGKVVDIDNWRNIVLATDGFGLLDRVVKVQIQANTNKIDTPFTLWLDQIYCAEIRNLLPYELSYGAGESRWNAIKDIANLLDCYVGYDKQGDFYLDKRKFPKERHSADFEYDAYEVLEPVVTYNDIDRKNNIYAGSDDMFEEHELSNHVQVVGGSTSSRVVTMVDLSLYNDGLHMREKGKLINRRGKIRAVDQFHPTANPTIFNKDTDVERVYEYHQNLDAVVKEYPNGFPHLEEPPISNFAIERIGDFIYHHNEANPDPLIVYAYEGKNRALWELRKRLAYAEQLDIISVPYYTLEKRDIIRVEDSLLDIDDNFQVKSMHIPLDGDYMSISATKIRNMIIDIPYFDVSSQKANACWYGYDAYALAFTYPL